MSSYSDTNLPEMYRLLDEIHKTVEVTKALDLSMATITKKDKNYLRSLCFIITKSFNQLISCIEKFPTQEQKPPSPYERIRTYTVEETFHILRCKEPLAIEGNKVNRKSNGLRMQTFLQKGVTCSFPGCQLSGSFFAVERFLRLSFAGGNSPFHLNLYGIDPTTGEEVQFTIDHTIARGLGGADSLDNTTTMCKPHNAQKGIQEGIAHLKLSKSSPQVKTAFSDASA
jgi:hypothetical protein